MVTRGALPVTIAPSGVALGRTRAGGVVTVPVLMPGGSTRVAAVGRAAAGLMVLRLLGLCCHVTVVGERSGEWRRFASALPSWQLDVRDEVRGWPSAEVGAPTALVVDDPRPPAVDLTDAPWSTVVHVAAQATASGAWWRSAHLVLAPGAAGELLALEPLGRTAFVPDVTADERRLLATL